jgi:hypothetical protein
MKRVLTAAISTLVPAAFGQTALSQQDNPLLGSWTIVSIDDVRPDGSKHPVFGSSLEGMLIFDAEGRYSMQLCETDRPKFAAGDRSKGTPEENAAAVHGCNPHWGRYSVDQADQTIVFKIDHALFKNWEGTVQKRSFKLSGDELSYRIPNPSETGVNPVVVWKRLR